MYKKALQNINRFYASETTAKNNTEEMFRLLKDTVVFDSCAVFYLVPDSLSTEYATGESFNSEYSVSSKLTDILYNQDIDDISGYTLKITKKDGFAAASRLLVNGVVFGIFCIFRKTHDFTEDEKLVFQTFSNIIAGIIKDDELSKILSAQAKTTETGVKELRNAYETIKKQNKKIKENEKIQNDFIANISHDLRTPLNSIICMSDALAGSVFGKLNTKQQEYINDIRVSGINLLTMVNEILDIAKIESHTVKMNLTDFDLNILTKEVCNILMPLCQKKNLKIINNVSSITINGDYAKLQQVMLNIAGNAVKFSHPNSEVLISAKKKKTCVDITIEDFGTGIAPKDIKKIFKKFYQAENPLTKTEPSTGLGLAIAKEFVKLHNGSIKAESIPDKHTLFTITLPVQNG